MNKEIDKLIEDLRIKSIQDYGLAEVESTKNSRYSNWLHGYVQGLDYCIEKLKSINEMNVEGEKKIFNAGNGSIMIEGYITKNEVQKLKQLEEN